ncbi:stabilizer of axonemal microtubules 1 isoform X2 [Amia ocellicauda]|uniref:stabilizer of axonemal microtubules 1 isoform X2 n=1 Tax=Amia ocellicauda TaxID=2972642 RepID=UPI003464D50E
MDFPEFNCICELCNCGRHKHHKDCKKSKTALQIGSGSENCLLSHYSSSYTRPHNARVRSSKRPFRTPLHPAPPCMALRTTQRSAYRRPPPSTRAQPAPRLESVCGSLEPIQSHSVYSLDFPAKEGEAVVVRRPPTSLQRPPPGAQLSQHTTARDSYPDHSGVLLSRSLPSLGELPAVVGSLLFPDRKEEMKTITQSEFIWKTGSKPELSQSISCNLRVEGEQDLLTTHHEVYCVHPVEGAVPTRRQRPPEKEEAVRADPMESLTKYRSDYPAHYGPPRRSLPARPPPDNLVINQALRRDFRTVQRDTYPGWDASKHRRPDPAQLREELSDWDKDCPFQGDTVTKLAYQPLPLNSLQAQPLQHRAPCLKVQPGLFHDTTASKEFFQDWGAQRRRRCGDPHDGLYIKPLGKLESETTSSSTFIPKSTRRVQNCRPEQRPVQAEGEHDFTTVHNDTYRPLSLPVCRLQLYLAHKQQQQKHLVPPAVPT